MPAEITAIDRSMISNMMLSKSYSKIASALDITKDDVGAVVLDLTLGTGLVPFELKLKAARENRNAAGERINHHARPKPKARQP